MAKKVFAWRLLALARNQNPESYRLGNTGTS